jgi:hypothetical protein
VTWGWNGPSKEDVAGRVARRLAAASNTNERIAVASAAIDLIGAASRETRRPEDIICRPVVTETPVFAPVPPTSPPLLPKGTESGSVWRSDWLKMTALALVAMAVVLLAGVIALSAQRPRPATIPHAPLARAATQPAWTGASRASAASAHTWVVQVGAFLNQARSQSLVERLKQSGFPTFAIPRASANGRLNVVRVGPFNAASEADDALDRLRRLANIDNAFVRSVTTIP